MKPPKPYRACSCRGPAVIGPDGKKRPGKLLGKKCPKLGQKNHGAWYARYEAVPWVDGKRRQPRIGPYRTEKECKQAQVEAIGQVASGTHAADRKLTTGAYLAGWLSERAAAVSPGTLAGDREAVRLYYQPGIGHIKLADLRDHHIRAAYAAMRKINRPEAADESSEVLRRLIAARARVPHLPTHLASTKPLSEAGIRRRHAVLSAALNDAVDRHLIGFSPAATVRFRIRKARPLLWTQARVDRWRQDGKRPATVMVWSPEQAGEFLDSIEADRMYPLFHLACYWGLRRGELCQLEWSNLNLATRRLRVRGDVKSEDSDRIIVIDGPKSGQNHPSSAEILGSWQEIQLFERLEWGDGWQDSGRVFTQEDGRPLRPAHVSEHFKVLTRQAGLPPLRFHDLRHGSASMQLAAGTDLKVVSETMGHSTSAFTADVYVTVLEEMGEAAAAAIAAFVPRKARPEAAQ